MAGFIPHVIASDSQLRKKKFARHIQNDRLKLGKSLFTRTQT